MKYENLIEGPDGIEYGTAAACGRGLEEHGVTNAHDRIRDWIRRGLLEPVHVLEGRKFYSMHDVRTVEAKTRENGRRRNRLDEQMEALRKADPGLFE